MLIRAAACAASCEFTVNDDSGNAADAVVLRFGADLGLVHVVDHDFVRRAGNPFDEFDRFFACGTSCAENFDSLLCGHGVLLKNLLDFLLTTVGTGCGIVRSVPARPCIPERSAYQYSDRAVYGGSGIPRELA